MTEPITIEVHAETYPNGNTEFDYKYYNDLLNPLKLSETQLREVFGEVANNINLDTTGPVSLVAIATFDDADDANPKIDYRVETDAGAPDVTVVENDDAILIENTDDRPTLEDSDIIVADS